MSSRIQSAVLASLLGTLTVAACAGSETDLSGGDIDAALPDGDVDGGGFTTPDADVTTDSSTPPPDAAGSVCGNNVEEAGEQCDDGNLIDGDGCSATCQLESGVEGDVCPGQTLALNESVGALLRGSVTGSTASAFNHYGSACGGGSGKDVVYTFTVPTSGKATLTLDADFLAIVSARSDCTDAVSEVGCASRQTNASGPSTLEFPVFANTPVFVMIDGYAGSEGNFTLTAEVSTASCGNGVAELPERCDDGNLVDGDGCSATCELEAGGVLGQCPGQPFRLTGALGAQRKISFAGNTATDGSDPGSAYDAPACYYGDGNNVVYAILPDVDGSAHAELVAGYRRSALHVRNECASNDFQLECAVRETAGSTTLDFPVRAGEWFYLFADARQAGGPFTASLTVTPSACGNGRLDGNEQCDDGNTAAGDGCSATCMFEPTPDANTCAGQDIALGAPNANGVHQGLISGTTRGLTNKVYGCRTFYSAGGGDAIYKVTAPIGGALKATLGGPFQSQVSILSGNPCAQPPSGSSTRLDNVMACSNGVFIPANFNEEPFFLDGINGPSKSVTAPVVAGSDYYVVVDSYALGSRQSTSGPFTLQVEVAPAVCGNGILEGGETCDDGNTASDDGCSATCTLEDPNYRNTCATAQALSFSEQAGTHRAAAKASTAQLGATQNFGTGCPAPGPDAYFKVTAPASGILRATAKSDAFDVVLGLRRTDFCDVTGAPLACADGGPQGSEESLARVVEAGEEFYVVVDSPGYPAVNGCTGGSTQPDCELVLKRGLFDLEVTVSPSVCGDGFFVPGPNEACDDGNLIDGDGCSSTCQIETLANVNTCPGQALTLTGSASAGYRGALTVATAALTANYTSSCGGSARDGVVRVTAPANGSLRAQATGMDGVTVYARAVCNDPNTEFRKTSSSTCFNVVHDTVTLQAVAGQEYFLFVDGLEGATGVPTLTVTLEP